eukprot:scaffold15918_cov73-Phaeocystis_antarctica.AAC.6
MRGWSVLQQESQTWKALHDQRPPELITALGKQYSAPYVACAKHFDERRCTAAVVNHRHEHVARKCWCGHSPGRAQPPRAARLVPGGQAARALGRLAEPTPYLRVSTLSPLRRARSAIPARRRRASRALPTGWA